MSERAYNRLLSQYERQDAAAIAEVARDSQSPAVRTLLRLLVETANMAGNPFTPDPLTTAFNSGKMSVGQEIFAALSFEAPHLYPQLLMEIADDNDRRTRDLADRLGNGRDDA